MYTSISIYIYIYISPASLNLYIYIYIYIPRLAQFESILKLVSQLYGVVMSIIMTITIKVEALLA